VIERFVSSYKLGQRHSHNEKLEIVIRCKHMLNKLRG